MGLFHDFFNNTRKPEGLLGKIMASSMNHGHLPLHIWGLRIIPYGDYSKILDMGCGGGRTASLLLNKYPNAIITAADYSYISLEMTKKTNSAAVNRGRLRVVEADVSKLPFEDESYDLVTAFETVYFWPGPLESFKEIYRILSKGGRFVIVNGTASKDSRDAQWVNVIDGMTVYEEDDFRNYLTEVGFKNIDITFNRFGWFCLSATK